MKTKNILFIISMMCITFMQSCSNPNKDCILIPYPNWAEGIAITHLAQVALEDAGYQVTIKSIEPGPIFASLAKGDADIFMDAWLPYTHKDYFEKYGDQIEKAGVIFDEGTTGLVVPEYVSISSIEELNKHKDRFQGKIYGIGSGAGIHANTIKVIQEYGLDFQQITSSEASMLTALKRAELNEDWVIITGWKPHFMWYQHTIKYLEDPKNIYPVDEIQILTRKGFAKDHPRLAGFLKNFRLSEELLYELMQNVSNAKDAGSGAQLFYQNHKTMIKGWIEK